MEAIKGLFGFATDKELIDYCDSHCETPRALFHKNQIAKMIKLAGEPGEEFPSSEEMFEADIEWHSIGEPMKKLIQLARERLGD